MVPGVLRDQTGIIIVSPDPSKVLKATPDAHNPGGFMFFQTPGSSPEDIQKMTEGNASFISPSDIGAVNHIFQDRESQRVMAIFTSSQLESSNLSTKIGTVFPYETIMNAHIKLYHIVDTDISDPNGGCSCICYCCSGCCLLGLILFAICAAIIFVVGYCCWWGPLLESSGK